MKYVGWLLIVVSAIMMVVSGIRAYDTNLVGLNQVNAIKAAVQPWFWALVVGQILLILKVRHLPGLRDAIRETRWADVQPFILSWILKVIGLFVFLFGFKDVIRKSDDGANVDLSFSEAQPVFIILGLVLILCSELHYRRMTKDD